MAGLVPAIHAHRARKVFMDPRHKAGDDDDGRSIQARGLGKRPGPFVRFVSFVD
jgi:hypothetical protein